MINIREEYRSASPSENAAFAENFNKSCFNRQDAHPMYPGLLATWLWHPPLFGKPVAKGFSLVEALVALAITGLIMTLTIQTLLRSPANATYVFRVSDYLEHLAAVARVQELKTGQSPIHSGNANGLAAILPTLETGATHVSASPEYLDYPGGLRVYLRPEQLVGTVTGLSNPIYTGTNNREWLLLDLNRNTAPTNLSTNGDLVLVRVHNGTQHVYTARQVDAAFPSTFYDSFKGY